MDYCWLSLLVLNLMISGNVITAYDARRMNYYKLIHEVLDARKYDPRIAPVGSDDFVEVFAYLEIDKIISLSSSKGTLTLAGSLLLAWQDLRLSWNSSAYGNVNSIEILAAQTWFPRLVLFNGIQGDLAIQPRTGGPRKSIITVENTGWMMWTLHTAFTFTCSVKVIAFPNDKQNCVMKISPYEPLSSKVRLVAFNPKQLSFGMQLSNQWQFIESVQQHQVHSVVDENGRTKNTTLYNITITLRRHYQFYTLTIILPMIMLAIIIHIPFLLPPQNGPQKVSIPVSIFLSYVVFLLLLDRIMPKNQAPPAIAYRFVALMIVCCATELLQAVTVKMWNIPGNREMPRFLKRLYHDIFAKITCYSGYCQCGRSTSDRFVVPKSPQPITYKKESEQQDDANDIHVVVVADRPKQLNEMSNEDLWKEAARINDRLGFIIIATCSFAIMISTIFFSS